MTTTGMEHKVHLGRNVKRLREMLGVKQDALATDLNVSQQTISQLEQRETIDEDLLQQISNALKVPVEAIKNFDEERAIFNIQNNYDNAANNINYQFNPIDKIVQLYDEKIALYERMLKDREDMINELRNR